MDEPFYVNILQTQLRPAALKYGRNWRLQQNNDPSTPCVLPRISLSRMGPSEGVFVSEDSITKEVVRRKQGLPFPIASNVSQQEYNSFIENKEISGYKLDYRKGTVYIVEMASTEHEAVIEVVGNAFRKLCLPLGQPLHDAQDGICRAPDLAVYPHLSLTLVHHPAT
ncbi:180_t:CDS:2 [Paraglomus occultum]|uniref:180_t:CDS:1 n=1 Tax=Paraglomus occultum TaxID=144539 RepID=A0A9N8ZK98_9GLOM|nr:180_t:CDS:2 [Paraglomus occultum]